MKMGKALEHLSYGERLKTARTAHLREEKAQEESHQCVQTSEERLWRMCSQTLFSDVQWQEKRQWAQTEKWEGHFEHCLCFPEKFSPFWKCSRTGCMWLWVTQSGGRYSCPSQGGCNSCSLRFIPTQVILWFYGHQALFYWEDGWVLAQLS